MTSPVHRIVSATAAWLFGVLSFARFNLEWLTDRKDQVRKK
jgi:hypothetical protein